MMSALSPCWERAPSPERPATGAASDDMSPHIPETAMTSPDAALPPRAQRLNRRSLIKATAVGGFVLGATALTTVALPASAAAFGYTDDGSNYVVDTGASLVFKVSKSNGDLVSFVYRGVER